MPRLTGADWVNIKEALIHDLQREKNPGVKRSLRITLDNVLKKVFNED